MAISSNSTTCQPGYPLELVDAFLAGDEDRARTLAEALRRELQDTDFPVVGRITASFGLADYEADPGPAALVARADEAMYRAKQSGRNQVIVAPTTAAVSRRQ